MELVSGRGVLNALFVDGCGAAERETEVAEAMAAARAAGYAAVIAEARAVSGADPATVAGAVRRLRGQLRRIGRRDYFPSARRAAAHAAVEALAVALEIEHDELA